MTQTPERKTEVQLSEVLSDFARTMATNFPIQGILDHLIRRIAEMLPVDGAGVTLISESLNPRYVSASNSDSLRNEKLQTELHEGPCLLAYGSDDAVLVPELLTETRFPTFTARALVDGMRAVFAFPLRHGDQRLGALDLYRNTPGALTETELTTAQTLADVAAAYLINAQARVDLQDSSDRSRELALHDGLTGLPNRTLMLERLQHAFQRGRRTSKILAVLFVDLDGFKSVNDHYGHSVGDQLLVVVAKRLSSLLRPPDTLARLHGDEFVILCEELQVPGDAAGIVSRLRAAVSQPFQVGQRLITLTASVGISFADSDVHDPEQVLRDADTAMYRAKRNGGDGLLAFDGRYQHLAYHRNDLDLDLAGALDREEMHAEYQAIVTTDRGEIAGFEALLRWTHPKRGVIPPATFIPLAEQSELITELGSWVLRQACTDLRRWQDRRPPDAAELAIAVNVSPRQVMAAGFVDSVDDTLRATHTKPGQVTLEITESVFVHDSKRALIVLQDLKGLGVDIALDDFGTGYSSLSYLNQFPVDIVKIDRSFVANLGIDSVSEIIAAAVVELAHALQMTVVAEGIETADQHQQVRALGCDFSQGFYFARPMTADNVDTLIDPAPHPGRQLPSQRLPRVAASATKSG